MVTLGYGLHLLYSVLVAPVMIGLALFMALSLGTLCAFALRDGSMPRWLAWLGLVSTALLAGLRCRCSAARRWCRWPRR